MLLFLIEFLKNGLGFSVPVAFEAYTTRMLLAMMTGLILSIFLGPSFIKKLYELKVGQPIRKEECPQLAQLHEKKENTPTMGGVLILFSMLICMFIWMDWRSSHTLLLLITTLLLGGLGGYDDYLKLKYRNAKGLGGKKKLLVQSLLVVFIGLYLYLPSFQGLFHWGSFFPPLSGQEMGRMRPLCVEGSEAYLGAIFLPFVKNPVLCISGFAVTFLVPFFFFVVVGASNAVNLTDGLDGLAGGCLIMVAGVLALAAFISNHLGLSEYLNVLYIEGAGEVGIYLAALMGACLGFLWYNGHPAQVFMGDIGSLALGGVLGVSAILLRREFLLALAGGIFVAEAFSVIIQVWSYRTRGGKRVFLCTPLHHHFEFKGWAETKIVLRFWIVGLLLALLSVASFKLQ